MNEITYVRVGNYFLPEIALLEPPPGMVEPLGRYAYMRRSFLKEHRPVLYAEMPLTERLYPHLREIDESAAIRLAVIADRDQAAEVINELIYE